MPKFDDSLINKKMSELNNRGEEGLVRTLAPKHGLDYVNLIGYTINPEALRIVDEQTARAAEVVIFDRSVSGLSLALKNPNNSTIESVIKDLESKNYVVHKYLASAESLMHAWERYQDRQNTAAKKRGVLDISTEKVAELSESFSSHHDVATALDKLSGINKADRISSTLEIVFAGAFALGASDIHIEPEQNTIRLRYRIDGALWDVYNIDSSIHGLITSRLKLISGLKLNIHNEAQDGRFTFAIGVRELEVRTSVIPGSFGESIVMRLLDPDASSFKLETLGLNERLLEVMLEELQRPNGAIITTGPTGSGKTTALYAFMQEVHKPEKKIITIEDPVEYKLPGIVQTQVDDEYTFASGLRAVLRQDPDVLMVGEIRDREVAETVVHAALTGHLVFSTLHTNSAPAAFARLIDLGVDFRMIGSAFNVILGQRLVRKLCEHCRKSRDTTTEEQKMISRVMGKAVPEHIVYEAPGCGECGDSGYKGRIGIYEAVRVDKAVEEALNADQRESSIITAATAQNIPSMQQDGIIKVLAGVTSIDELARVVDLYNYKAIADKISDSSTAETSEPESTIEAYVPTDKQKNNPEDTKFNNHVV